MTSSASAPPSASGRRLVAQISNYSIANVLTTVAGLISFPLLTRLLSVENYGVMNLVTTALGLAVALGKLGLQHSTLRFYAEQEATGRQEARDAFLSTTFYGMAAAGLAATLLTALAAYILPASIWNGAIVQPFLLLASPLVLIRVLESAAINQLRAQERSGPLALFNVLKRYASLMLILGVLAWVSRDLWGLYGATVVTELVALMTLLGWLFRPTGVPKSADISRPLLGAMLIYGLPMLGYEAATILLTMGDRYVIQRTMGAEALGIYAATYNLCDYVRAAMLAAMSAAAFPAALRMWEHDGPQATQAFVRRFVHVYAAIAALVVAGTSAVAPQLMTLLASQKYMSGATTVPWIMSGMAIDSAATILGLGLYLRKRSSITMLLVACSACLNVALNLWWVPSLGINGAAIAMFVSFSALVTAQALVGRRVLALPFPLKPVVGYAALGIATYHLVVPLHWGGELATMVLRGTALVTLYSTIAICVDRVARQRVVGLLERLWHRLKSLRA